MPEIAEIRYCVNGPHKGEPKPRVATHGHFCGYEYGSARHALKIVPGLVQHITSLIPLLSASDDSGKVRGSRDPGTPGNDQARDDANGLYRMLTSWSQKFAEGMKVNAPGPAMRAWRSLSGEVIGLPTTDPGQARYETGVMATWLDVNLPSIFYFDPELVNRFALTDLRSVFQLNARWPSEMRPRFSDVPCPTCTDQPGGAIAVYPPEGYLEDEHIVCVKCGRWFEPKDYEFLVEVFKQQHAEGLRSGGVRRHLARKYTQEKAS